MARTVYTSTSYANAISSNGGGGYGITTANLSITIADNGAVSWSVSMNGSRQQVFVGFYLYINGNTLYNGYYGKTTPCGPKTFPRGSTSASGSAGSTSGGSITYRMRLGSGSKYDGTYGVDTGTVTVYRNSTTYYTVTFYPGYGSNTALKSQEVTYGGSASPPSVSRAGYNFAGWSGAYTGVTGDSNVTATWAQITYPVTYNANGGSGAPAQQTKVWGTNLTLSSTVPTRGGYLFMGWATSSTATQATYQPDGTYSTEASLTLYAVWMVAELIGLDSTKFPKEYELILYSEDGLIYGEDENPYGGLSVINYVPIYAVTTEDNSSVNFYVMISGLDKEGKPLHNGTIYGPFNANGLVGTNYISGETVELNSSIIKDSIRNLKEENYTKIAISVCTGDNSFNEEATIDYIVSVYTGYRLPNVQINTLARDGAGFVVVDISYNLSMNNNVATFYKDLISITSPANVYTTDLMGNPVVSAENNNYTCRLKAILGDEFEESGKIETSITDGLITDTKVMRYGPTDDDILIYPDNSIHATEFIEGDRVDMIEGGTVYANEFIETDEGICIGGVMYFGELVEK